MTPDVARAARLRAADNARRLLRLADLEVERASLEAALGRNRAEQTDHFAALVEQGVIVIGDEQSRRRLAEIA